MVELARAAWPEPGDTELPRLAGFTVSSFNPLVAETADRCLTRWHGAAPLGAVGRTALVLVSSSGDVGTARAIAGAVADGRRVPPLLFFQSNPNAVLGHLAARWLLTGPVLALGSGGEPVGLAEAELLLSGGEADLVLLVAAEQATADGESDHATAVLLAPAH
ncbi:hypothetical protein C7C46_15110 [Streptomyces tateyamensis]|uniref:Beta-ketoacyl synthase N-terminal domain-containing protein n=1 Tax=Streptomyces tateyamensis TaxID=565073 RepID=A0A2V4N6Z4_9ACTN|nr:hypothetical protein [Streptomyces tateyamensis]PYC78845.1 hypothetical protein C7C46_15110 [Streptomyces tateyamensis]